MYTKPVLFCDNGLQCQGGSGVGLGLGLGGMGLLNRVWKCATGGAEQWCLKK